MQSLLGVVSSNFRLVSISHADGVIRIKIILARHHEEDIEEIDELKTEFEALLPGSTDYEVEVVVSEEPISLKRPTASTIIVYMRRE